jgi:hypothetical protein
MNEGGTMRSLVLVYGLTPNGVKELDLDQRIGRLAGPRLIPVRLECRLVDELPRFFRLPTPAHGIFARSPEYCASAVTSGTEPPAVPADRLSSTLVAPTFPRDK